jgi:hypothetical protein
MKATLRSHGARQIAISTVVGLVAAVLAFGTVGHVSTAATHVFVDMPSPTAVNWAVDPVPLLVQRGELLGNVMTSPPVVERIGRIAGVPANQIGAFNRTTYPVQQAFTEVPSEQRANDIPASRLPYRLEVQARQETPVLDVFARAPTTAAAERLANAAVVALNEYVGSIADDEAVAATYRVNLRQLGSARGSVVNGGMAPAVAVMAFLVAFAVTLVGLRLLARRRRGRENLVPASPDPMDGDDWPHTTRLLPWMFAGFLAVLWLVPFNYIQLTVKMPIDLKFDRLVLPFVVATWAIALMVGGRARPRLRPTWIHAGVGVFVLCAFLSVIANAGALNRDLELDGSVKALPLLLAYASLFVLASTGVRAREVRAFLTYTVVLGVICAIGVLWEYRFKQNLFYEWSDKLLPSQLFTVEKLDTSAVDDVGRRLVRGPAALPLETVAMLAMALPIALVRLTEAEGWRKRVVYGLAVALVLSASLATFRKSALLGPVAVILMIAYFRRRELLKLAPLALVLVVFVHVLAPGALGKTSRQFDPSALGVTTVSDRSADYDAIRPDLWTHLLLGRGWGGYPRLSYRTLDSQILGQIVEMGTLGLIAFLLMIVAVVAGARATIGGRDPTWAPMALQGAAAAVSFLVMSTLFDVMAFPHATYIFLYMAGLVAVVVKHREACPEPRALHGPEHEPPAVANTPREPALRYRGSRVAVPRAWTGGSDVYRRG